MLTNVWEQLGKRFEGLGNVLGVWKMFGAVWENVLGDSKENVLWGTD